MKRINHPHPKLLLTTSMIVVGALACSQKNLSAQTQSPKGTGSPLTHEAQSVAQDVNIFANLAKKVVPSVVNISATVTPKRFSPQGPGDLFRKHFEEFFSQREPLPSPRSRPHTPTALGSGFVIDRQGDKVILLTNNHVIDRATQIQIQFDSSVTQKSFNGQIIGKDPELDTALIEVRVPKNIKVPALPFGDSEALRVGDYVMAVGNPFGQGHSVSHGIISAKGRSAPIIGRYLQTDTPINPGNSGGPLVNLKGEMIGVNNAILAQAQGIGFAIPSNSVRAIIEPLRNNGKVDRGYLGVTMAEVTSEAAAFAGTQVKVGAPFVTGVEPGSPAETAGLKPNDIIVEFNKKQISSPSDLLMAVTSTPVGDKAAVKVLRSGSVMTLKVQVGKRSA